MTSRRLNLNGHDIKDEGVGAAKKRDEFIFIRFVFLY